MWKEGGWSKSIQGGEGEGDKGGHNFYCILNNYMQLLRRSLTNQYLTWTRDHWLRGGI